MRRRRLRHELRRLRSASDPKQSPVSPYGFGADCPAAVIERCCNPPLRGHQRFRWSDRVWTM